MEYRDKNTSCVVVKCRIEAKEASGEKIHGFYMCVADARDIEYDGALFSRDPIDAEIPLSELYATLEAPAPDEPQGEMRKYENGLKDYVRTSRLFQSEKSLGDTKALEHKITFFCASAMSLNVISFLELTAMSRNELYAAIPSLERGDEPESGEVQNEQEEQAANIEATDLPPSDVTIPCDPVLDPGSPACP
ncbi:MAG: hypothetical protein LBL05_09095 [Synergistaceae bacterium]|jgi:hypothetical protein|nr:hypothetical protein [Synergistaceae bacterium]